MFEASTYMERRKGLRERVGSGLILFLGNDPPAMNYADNPYHFKQDSSFLYYFGLDQAGLAGVIDADSGEETVFGHEPTLDEIVWMGPQPSLASECAHVGVNRSAEPEKLGEMLRAGRDAGRTIHFLPQYRAWNRIKLARMLGIPGLSTDDHVSRPLLEAVVDQRLYKTDEEVAEIEIAIDISYDMHTLAMHMVQPGMVEREVAGAVEGVVLSRGGLTSFPIIFSVRGEVLAHLRRLGDMRTGAGKTAQAEEQLRQALDIQRKSFPEDHWEVANTKSLMGVCRVEERRYAEAESLLLSAHDVIESRLGGAHPLTRASLERIVLLYESWNKPEEAAKYRALLADVDESQ